MNRLIRALMVLLLTPAMWVLVEEAGYFLTDNLPRASSNWALYGLAGYLVIYLFIPRNVSAFFEILEHEFTHAIFAYLCLKGVTRLEVRPPAHSGQTEHEGPTNTLIRLAPYCLPPIALLPLLLKYLVFPDSHGLPDLLIGVTLAFHLVGLVMELSETQTDITRTGIVHATWIILFTNTVLLVIALGVVLSDYTALENYFALSFARIPPVYDDVMRMLEQGLQWTSRFE